MYCFIPSWYESGDAWNTHYAPWDHAGNSFEFDDTVNQIRMFRDAGEEVELICLGYAPNLRRFLHQQNIYPLPFRSVFDDLQKIRCREPAVLSYRELHWPAETEWFFLSSRMLAYLHGTLYASVEFAEGGFMCWVQYYEMNGTANRIRRRDIYDDRGFRSSSILYREGVKERQEYYAPDGRLCFFQLFPSGEVVLLDGTTLNGGSKDRRFSSMDELIREAARLYFSDNSKPDTVVIAANRKHDSILLELLGGRKDMNIVLSFFGNRYDLADKDALFRETEAARLVVTDTEHTAKMLQEAGVLKTKLYDISPFDTRLSLGKSQQVRELKIFMPLDGLEGILLEKALRQVFDYMERKPDVILLAGTRAECGEEQERLRRKLQDVLESMGKETLQISYLNPERAQSPESAQRMENEQSVPESRVRIALYHSENDLIRILYDTRLILDVRDQPDLYLQIAGISSGIPQVNYRFTRYVEHLKDGYIIQNINYITGALEYYLDGLAHWNEALVYCVQEVSSYAGGRLVEQWKKRLGK